MSRPLLRIAEILSLADSKKVLDRKNFLADLQSLYLDHEFIEAINEQSRTDFKSPTSWNQIMLLIHQIIIAEAEKTVPKNPRGNSAMIIQSGCCSLLLRTVSLACSTAHMSLSCTDLMAISFQILRNKIYELYHDTYIDILANHVFVNKNYRLEISHEHWQEILKITLSIYDKKSNVVKSVLLDTARMAVLYGCMQSHLQLNIKPILPFLEKIFKDIALGKEMLMKPVYKLTYVVCEQMAIENRLTICEFSEKNFPSIINLEGCPEKYNLLLLVIQIHHPCGAGPNDDVACAHDWVQWKTMIRGIHLSIVRDMKAEKLSLLFLNLACEVYRQIMLDTEYFKDEMPSCSYSQGVQPRKRRRLSLGMKKPLDLLMDNDPDTIWPFTQILTVLLKKFPSTLKSDDYVAFLKTVTELVTASLNNEPMMNSLCELCTVLVQAEKEHYLTNEQIESVKVCWEKIWDTIPRALTMNLNELSGHKLLQSIIAQKHTLNPNGFLRLYVTNAIRWSPSSVKTLLTFCEYTTMPNELSSTKLTGMSSNSEASTRVSLLRWCLQISNKLSSHTSMDQLANLLTVLTFKSWNKREFRESRHSHEHTHLNKILANEAFVKDLFDDRDSRALSDIERCHLALAFQGNLRNEANEEIAKNIGTNVRVMYEPDALDILLGALNDFMCESDDKEGAGTLVPKLIVLAKLMSNFAQFPTGNDTHVTKVETLFRRQFMKMHTDLKVMDKAGSIHLLHTIEALEFLYSSDHHPKVAKILVTLSSMDYLEFIFNLLSDDDEDDNDHISVDENSPSFNMHEKRSRQHLDKSVHHPIELTNSCRLHNAAHRILAHFCCLRIGEEMTEAQKRVMKNLMKINMYGSTGTADLRRALILLKTYGNSKQLGTSQELLEIANSFLRQLFETRLKDESAVRGVLNVLPHFFQASLRFVRQVEKLFEILITISKRLEKKRYGSLVQADFITCVGLLIRSNPQLTWRPNKMEETTSIIDILVCHINNPFYVVRLQVIRALHDVFSSNDLEHPLKLKLFGKIESAIGNLLHIDDSLDENAKQDEWSTRTNTAVHFYATVIRANDFLRSSALFSLLKLAPWRDVKASTLKKALLSITCSEQEQRNLIESTLYYILSRWFEAGYPLPVFPWAIVDCKTQEDFSRKYITQLLMIKLQRREFGHIAVLCANLNISFESVIENGFSSIMALLMSVIVQNTSKDHKSEAATYARGMYDRLRSNTGEFKAIKQFNVLLEEKLSDIIVDLVKRIRDEQHFYQLFEHRVFLPTLIPSNFNTETVDRCLLCLQKVLSLENQTLIQYLVTRRPSVLQKVMLTLICNIYAVNSTTQKLQVFHQYAYFVTTTMQELENSYFDPMALYVVKDTTHSILALIKEGTEPLSEIACKFFNKFLSAALPARSLEIKEILSYVVSTLIPIVQSSKVKGAMAILRYLIIDQGGLLGDAIRKLDSFPNEESFDEIKQIHRDLKYTNNTVYSLENEIEHFLNAINEKTLSCSLEGLVHVKNQLSTKKEELRMMYGRLERMRGFAEDCASSVLHKLVYKLVQLTRSNDSAVSLEAAKCLGELGPADLTTMILHPDNGYAEEDTDKIMMLTLRIVNQLADYIFENNMQLRRTSSDALYTVLSSSCGLELMNNTLLNDLMSTYKIDNPKLNDYIYPFRVKGKSLKSSRALHIDRENWRRCIDRTEDLWMPAACDSYSKWIIDITTKLLDCFVNFYAASLKPVCQESVEFCEMLLPRLVNLIKCANDDLGNDVCNCINHFFVSLYQSICETDPTMTITDSPVNCVAGLSYECVRCMINVVNFMRIQSPDNALMSLQYLYIAKAAQYCSAYFTSVLYAELWCESLLQNSGLLQDKVPGSWISVIDLICELKPEPGKLLQDIVRDAYLHIGDPDSIYGCGLSHLIDSSFRTRHYIYLRQWDKVMVAQDVELSCGNSSTRGILHTLKQSGLQSLLGRVISTVDRETENIDDFMYESAWRLADWSLLESDCINENCDNSTSPNYHASHYRALKCFRDNDSTGVKDSLENARASIVKLLRKTSLECSQTVYPILSQLQMLREIEDFATADSESRETLIMNWLHQSFVDTHDFQYIEPILAQRLAIYQIGDAIRYADGPTNRAFVKTHLKIAEIAENQGYLPIAARYMDSLAKVHSLSNAAKDQLTYQEALLAWKRNDHYIGRYLLRNLIKKSSLSPSLRAKALRVYGNWMAQTKSENPRVVIEEYYEESIRTSQGISEQNSRDSKNLTDAQADLAQFADAQYQQIIEFMKSPQYDSLVECSKLENDEMSRKPMTAKDKDERKAIVIYQKQVTNDAAELEEINRERKMYLYLAAQYYLVTLQNGDEHDLLIFRLVSLWLDNTSDEDLNILLQNEFDSVASYKFITLLPQLAPHMSNLRNNFTAKINDLMERCAMEHPHHTLPVLLALKNTHKDHDFKPPEKGSGRRNNIRPEARVVAAADLIDRLMKLPMRPIIQQMSDLSHALISLAYHTVTEGQGTTRKPTYVIPKTQPIMKIRNYEHISVPTVSIEVRPSRNYNGIVGIQEYVRNFDLPGGVNAPKKVICIGTDGLRRIELVKGQDDLRQDAVMQQVCTVMNSMLKKSKETKRRKLHIRTYKIVPLSQRSGVLEWCDNTLPISNVLCNTGNNLGMHAKYYPNDWSVSRCRQRLLAVDKKPNSVKLEAFLECCKNLHPAFHHFFMEKYPSAETWFERRLAYTRSVATTSMVGYMLGLGDRHFSNILIDQITAEVIHIDFGIAFAQGKVLAIPETVPFRLTRDMEVAMGICGVEGVMRRSCEETTTVLRDQRKILITLLQVLLYDPLFSWAITPVNANDHESIPKHGFKDRLNEDQDTRKTNKIAERALLRIEQKLQGTEDGIGSSVSGQVERLIQQARDPANLCRLYSGWQAYL